MARRVGNRSGVIAVGLSLALHGVLGLGLLVQANRSPARVHLRASAATGAGVSVC